MHSKRKEEVEVENTVFNYNALGELILFPVMLITNPK